MKKYRLNILLIVVLLIIWTIYQVFKPNPVNWEPTLINTDKNPYGTYILFHEAASLFPGQKISVSRLPVYNQLDDSTGQRYNYVLIAQSVSITNEEMQKLRNFAKSGNHIFIAAENISESFCDSLGLKINDKPNLQALKDSIFRFSNSRLEKGSFAIPSFAHKYFTIADSSLKITSILEDQQQRKVMVKIKIGEGSIILCSVPLMFSNWFVLREDMSPIPFKALSYLPTDRPLVWDEYQKQGRLEDSNPLRAIWENKALTWAYFLSLTGILLVVVFETRRRRSMVPVVVPLKNTTLEFVRVIGLLHYEQRNYTDIARKKANYFLDRIRLHYYLPTQNTDHSFIVALSEKSGYDLRETEKLMDAITYARNALILTADDLIELNKSIETFTIKTKLKI